MDRAASDQADGRATRGAETTSADAADMTSDQIAGMIEGMTVERQIGQLFAVGFPGTAATAELLDLIQRDGVGAVILFSRNIRSRDQTAELTDRLQAAAREAGHPYPLLIMTDQENGLVRRLGPESTVFPSSMALGAIDAAGELDDDEDAEQIVYAVARATARELLAHGINMNLAPVVDVNSNPANPVIGVRSFGEQAERVARLGAAAVRGYQDAGVMATLKHFPGHGDTAEDSHRALPVSGADLDRLEAVELAPFRRGITAGAAAVLLAHVALPALESALGNGPGSASSLPRDLVPATLSPAVARRLLRDRLGFDGLAVSDCLEMKAISRGVGTARGAVAALVAGIDLGLVSHHHDVQRASIDAVRAAVASGALGKERVREAAGRVLRAKARFLADRFAAAPALSPEELAAHAALSRRAHARSVTLVRDEAGLLPLRLASEDELLLVHCPSRSVSEAADRDDGGADALEAALRRLHGRVRSVRLAPKAGERIDDALQAARRAVAVVVVTRNAHLDAGAHQIARQIARQIAAVGRPVIGLAVGNPYDAGTLPEFGTYLATYGHTPPALDAAAEILLGQLPSRGRPPVTLAHQRG